ncbi:hypothetical protein CHS0354_024388, partial [Potamilus streckersoni]
MCKNDSELESSLAQNAHNTNPVRNFDRKSELGLLNAGKITFSGKLFREIIKNVELENE